LNKVRNHLIEFRSRRASKEPGSLQPVVLQGNSAKSRSTIFALKIFSGRECPHSGDKTPAYKQRDPEGRFKDCGQDREYE
jgi:hypothetical protein